MGYLTVFFFTRGRGGGAGGWGVQRVGRRNKPVSAVTCYSHCPHCRLTVYAPEDVARHGEWMLLYYCHQVRARNSGVWFSGTIVFFDCGQLDCWCGHWESWRRALHLRWLSRRYLLLRCWNGLASAGSGLPGLRSSLSRTHRPVKASQWEAS